jgi:ribosomal protein L14E/L6E/L27E
VLIVRGLVVKAVAGRDKSKFFVVIDLNKEYVNICDGKRRPVSKTKRKNIKHLSFTKVVLDEDSLKTNKKIRSILRSFSEKN